MKSSGRTVAKLALSSHAPMLGTALKPSSGDGEEDETSKKLLKVLAHLSGEGYKIR